MKGIDISQWQGDIDLAPYRNGFVIVRGGFWTSVDPWAERNIQKCEELSIPWGLYWYSYALNEAQAAQEAEACLRFLNGRKPRLGVWFDMEDADGYKKKHGFLFTKRYVSAITQAFVDEIRASGRLCGVYASKSWLTDYIKVDADAVWVAQWADKLTYNGQYDVWQYTDAGRVDGVTGKVDRNVCRTAWKKEEKKMAVYRYPKDVPEWGRATVDKLISRGLLRPEPDGRVDLSHDLVRALVINDRAGVYDA